MNNPPGNSWIRSPEMLKSFTFYYLKKNQHGDEKQDADKSQFFKVEDWGVIVN